MRKLASHHQEKLRIIYASLHKGIQEKKRKAMQQAGINQPQPFRYLAELST